METRSAAPQSSRVHLARSSLGLMLAAVLVFNLFDALLTLTLVLLGAASEANPVMALALEGGPLPFTLIKLGIVSAGVATLFHFRERRLAAIGARFAFGTYTLIMLYHLKSVEVIANCLSA